MRPPIFFPFAASRKFVLIQREHMLGILKDAYTVYFDEMAIDGAVPLLAAAYAFHSSNECYVLSRKVKLWSAEVHEFVHVFSVSELTADIYGTCRQHAYEAGMGNIRPHIDHMSSYIPAILICESMTDEAVRALETTRIRKNFLFSLHGWMEFRTVAVELSSGRIVANRAAREVKKFVRENLEKAQLRRS